MKRGRQFGLSVTPVAKGHVLWRHIKIATKQHPHHAARGDEARAVFLKVKSPSPIPLVLGKNPS